MKYGISLSQRSKKVKKNELSGRAVSVWTVFNEKLFISALFILANNRKMGHKTEQAPGK
jgi:hypothetical protein